MIKKGGEANLLRKQEEKTTKKTQKASKRKMKRKNPKLIRKT